MNHIYFTALAGGARLGAGEGALRVYAVEPTRAFEDDPNATDQKFPTIVPSPNAAGNRSGLSAQRPTRPGKRPRRFKLGASGLRRPRGRPGGIITDLRRSRRPSALWSVRPAAVRLTLASVCRPPPHEPGRSKSGRSLLSVGKRRRRVPLRHMTRSTDLGASSGACARSRRATRRPAFDKLVFHGGVKRPNAKLRG
jgi:hypothetical protein